jgi:hypothetical protein
MKFIIKSMMLFIGVFCLIAGRALAQTNLPNCIGNDFTIWNACIGEFYYSRSGVRYQGEFRNGKHDGVGSIRLVTGAKYVGGFKEGKWHGVGILYNPDGTISKQGSWDFNYLTNSFEVAQTASLNILNSERVKPNTPTTSSQIILPLSYSESISNPLRIEQIVKNDSRLPICQGDVASFNNCFGVVTYAGGARYQGEWRDGKRNGQGEYTFIGGNKYVGEYKDGKRSGRGTFTFTNGNKYVGEFKDGVQEGIGSLTFAYGDTYVGQFKNDKRNGQGITYNSDGTIYQSGFWDNGKLINPFAIDKNRFPFNSSLQIASQNFSSTNDRDSLVAEVELERKKRNELEQLITSNRERERISAELDAERRKRQELEAQLVVQPQPTQGLKRSAHALVIGNSAYPGSGRLDNPVNDANAISQKLRSMGFTVTTVTDANRQRLVQAMAQFRRTAAAADISLLFYAGHGVQIFGTNYILPTDVDQTDPAQATIQGVSLNSVVENFLPGKTKLVFLDACRDNALQRTNDRSVSKGLAPISAAQGTLISYATKDGQTAADGVGSKNSPFTQALLEHINDPQDIAVVLRKVREKVMRSTGGKQQPWEYGSLTGGELVLSRIQGGR